MPTFWFREFDPAAEKLKNQLFVRYVKEYLLKGKSRRNAEQSAWIKSRAKAVQIISQSPPPRPPDAPP